MNYGIGLRVTTRRLGRPSGAASLLLPPHRSSVAAESRWDSLAELVEDRGLRSSYKDRRPTARLPWRSPLRASIPSHIHRASGSRPVMRRSTASLPESTH